MPAGELFFVKEISRATLIAEEQPVLSFRADGDALFDKRAERRDAGARANHNHRRICIRRWLETMRWLDEYFHIIRIADSIREKRGSDTFSRPAMRFITDSAHGQMHFARMCFG